MHLLLPLMGIKTNSEHRLKTGESVLVPTGAVAAVSSGSSSSRHVVHLEKCLSPLAAMKIGPFGKSYLLFCQLCFGEGRRLVQRVTSDGQEYVEESIVAAECQHDKVETVNRATISTATFGINGCVHDLVPIFTRQNLKKKSSHNIVTRQRCYILLSCQPDSGHPCLSQASFEHLFL